MKILHLFLFKKVVKQWLNGSKNDCKQGLENSPITDNCDTVRCRTADWIRLYLCVSHNGGNTCLEYTHFSLFSLFFKTYRAHVYFLSYHYVGYCGSVT